MRNVQTKVELTKDLVPAVLECVALVSKSLSKTLNSARMLFSPLLNKTENAFQC